MRRAKGEGTIFRQANGLYCAKLPPERRADGSSFTPTFRGKTRQAAIDKRSAYLAAKTKGKIAAKGKGKEALLTYLLGWVETHPLADGTRKAYRGHINNHIGPWFGETIRLDAVTTAQVKDFIAYLGTKPGVSKATVERIRATLSKAMNCAVVAETILFNPVHLAKAPKPPSGKRAHKPLREEDIPLFVKVARAHRLWVLWAVLLGTGARLGEVLHLRWEDVSLKAGTVHFREHYERGVETASHLKTEESDRVVPLPSWALDALKGHQEETGGTRGLVFMTAARGRWEGGRAYSGRNVNRDFHKLLVLAGIENRRPHDLRHTYATMQLADGTDLTTVADLLGHAPGSPITREFYISVGTKAKDAAARRADSWIGDGVGRAVRPRATRRSVRGPGGGSGGKPRS